ncbi:antibiotic biosynthesis monooxygenase [Nocardioides sp.]|uniref:antibiotic biosynthesis monooxygenase family protein n=1 Tax=Nocardioides sp. TaxID=35761 RepID=UPI002CE06DA2|nr:antibiotic biosynthesis monooxygenase [Nocardioides sp.]HVX54982.1 antibiotic biosynthesis monooxygenase [Nocardioides sp.]
MIVEHAVLPVRPGLEAEFEAALAQALPIIRRQSGCRSAEVLRCLEQRSAYLLLAEWDSVAAHEEGFRLSADYQEWRALLHHFYDPFPAVRHFERLDA